MEIPFKSLRFPRASERWGVNFNRRVRHKNELAFWNPVTRPHSISRVSLAGDLRKQESGGNLSREDLVDTVRRATMTPSRASLLASVTSERGAFGFSSSIIS